jgi:hypothetical protein
MVLPVLVTVEEPKTAKLLDVPRFGVLVAKTLFCIIMPEAESISIDITK